MSLAPAWLFAGELTGVRLSSEPAATRVVLDLSSSAGHRLIELTEPDRVVIDLANTEIAPALTLPSGSGHVTTIRSGVQPGGVLRIVLDLDGPAESKSFSLAPEGAYGHRLVVDIGQPSSPVKRGIVESGSGDREVVIVIDAGHGGRDSGAPGRSGLREKDVVLDIARRLARLVDGAPGMRPVLVRRDDRFVELNQRLEIARTARADFFLSIHADSSENRNVHGATVYSIQPRRAAAEQRQRLADLPNAADLVGGVSLSEQEPMVARVLLDLTQNVSRGNSIIAGERMITRLSRITPMLRNTVQEGNYAVLTSPDIPSLLIETGFVTNTRDEANLRDPAYRDLIAESLFAGLLDYYRDNPPPDTYLARNPPPERYAPVRHVITRGETLSEIADRYRISLRELRRTNALSGDVIRIGQVLTIPAAR